MKDVDPHQKRLGSADAFVGVIHEQEQMWPGQDVTTTSNCSTLFHAEISNYMALK